MRYTWIALFTLIIATSILAIPAVTGQDIELEFKVGESFTNTFSIEKGDTQRVQVLVTNKLGEEKSFDIWTNLSGDDQVAGFISPMEYGLDDVDNNFQVSFNVTIDSNVIALGSYQINVTVADESNVTANRTEEFLFVDIIEKPNYDLSMSVDKSKLEIQEGGSDVVILSITNDGDADDEAVFTWEGDNETVAIVRPSPKQVGEGDTETVEVTVHSKAPGETTVKIIITSLNDPEVTASASFTVTITEKPDEPGGGDDDLLSAEVAGIPLIGLFIIIIVVPIILVLVIAKKKAKKKVDAQPGQGPITPQMAPPMGGAMAQPAGAPQPMVMHCPNCSGVIEVQNPSMAQNVSCMACGSAFHFPGTGQPPAQPQQPAYQPQQTQCPACGSVITISTPQRPTVIQCPGCFAQYNIQ